MEMCHRPGVIASSVRSSNINHLLFTIYYLPHEGMREDSPGPGVSQQMLFRNFYGKIVRVLSAKYHSRGRGDTGIRRRGDTGKRRS